MAAEFSLGLVAKLGLASRQAVYKSGDPGRWLQARLRREVLGRGRAWKKGLSMPVRAILARAEAIDGMVGRTRPIAKDSKELGRLLGVQGQGTVGGTLRVFLQKIVPALKARTIVCANVILASLGVPKWVRRAGLRADLLRTCFGRLPERLLA